MKVNWIECTKREYTYAVYVHWAYAIYMPRNYSFILQNAHEEINTYVCINANNRNSIRLYSVHILEIKSV